VKVRVPAKLNWDLRVIGRRADGFHELRSTFVGIALYDELEVEAGEPALVVHGADVGPEEDNLITLAEQVWREAGGVAPTVAWQLTKNIPSGAGLGGGSADAAAALRCLQQLADTPLSQADLSSVALGLGSDVPYFWEGRGAEVRGGRGETVLESLEFTPTPVCLTWPAFHVSTPSVYSALTLSELPSPTSNDLYEAAACAEPRLREMRSVLAEHGLFRMSGSGGAHFSIEEHAEAAQTRADSLKAEGLHALATTTLRLPTAEEVG